jgi:hypothetical protein
VEGKASKSLNRIFPVNGSSAICVENNSCQTAIMIVLRPNPILDKNQSSRQYSMGSAVNPLKKQATEVYHNPAQKGPYSTPAHPGIFFNMGRLGMGTGIIISRQQCYPNTSRATE